MHIILRLALSALTVFIAAYILPGVEVDGWLTALIVAIVLGVINTFIRPILTVLTLPITAITLGLFLLVLNALLVLLTEWLIPGFTIDGFWWALAFSIVISLIGSFFQMIGRQAT